MKLWGFKQKTPGFGISRSYYLTVLSATPTLPAILNLVNPEGQGGAVEGFGAPLQSDANKDHLRRPLERGAYVISTKDRKTVLKMLVIPKDEAGFDPGAFLRSPQAQGLEKELLDRISATWTLLQITFESHDPGVYEALRFFLRIAQRAAALTGGVVADPISQTYQLPEDVFANPQADPRVDARDFVRIIAKPREGKLWMFSLGMQKFGLAELEMMGVEPVDEPLARMLLISLCQKALLGDAVALGDRLGSRSAPFQVVAGGSDRGQWEGILCYELIPPTGKSEGEALRAWAQKTG
jgi:hypothetical protein